MAAEHPGDDGGDGRAVLAFWILAGPEGVEVAEADGFQAVAEGEDGGVQFSGVFGDRIRADREGSHGFAFGLFGLLSVGGTAGGIDDAPDAGLSGRVEHAECAGGVDVVILHRLLDGLGHADPCGFMKDHVDVTDGRREGAIVEN